AAMPGPACGSLLDYKTAKWVLLLRKGYQERDTSPRVAVVTKVKGAAAAEAAGRRLWDAADLTWPPQVQLGSGRGQAGHTYG
uniref:Uncharacterized protein n=1 Tax=Cyanoderma ruficeps TaxID=181631 RepID=A0A8C3QLD9_9PASS